MTLFLILPIFIHSKVDSDGIVFKDDDETILQSTPPNLKNYIIKSQVVSILGGSSTTGAFYTCRNSLESISFEDNSSLILIESFAFSNLKITTINMSQCTKLKALGYSTFLSCSNLELIIFPPNLETIKSGTFAYCGLRSITIPDSVVTIEGYQQGYSATFGNCKNLSEVNWGKNPSITTIGGDAFSDCNLTSFTIPSSMKDIKAAAFMGNPISHFEIINNPLFSSDGGILYNADKTKIFFYPSIPGNYSIPNGVKRLFRSSFRKTLCKEITIPSTLTHIEGLSFCSSKIVTMTFPSTVISVGDRCFENCTELITVNFECNIETLENKLFYLCKNLQSFSVPEGVKSISSDVFMSCTNIEEIWIPKSVTTIGESAFQGISRDCKIIFQDGSGFIEEDRILYSSKKDRIVTYIGSESTFDITVGTSIVTIGGSAFYNTGVRNVIFQNPSICQYIETNAFSNTPNLESIILPNSLLNISDGVFQQSGLTTITFPTESKVKQLGKNAFRLSKLKKIEIPKSVVNIHSICFQKCTNLISVILYEGNLSYIGENCFDSTSIQSIQIPSVTTNISRGAFQNTKITIATFNQGWKGNLPMEIFKDCKYLNEVSLSEGTTSIGRSSFEGCISLLHLRLPSSLEIIEMAALKGCSKLASVYIPDDSRLSTIESLAFYQCEDLTEMEVSNENKNFSTDNKALYSKDKSRIYLYLPGRKEDFYIAPSEVISVEAYAFQNAAKLIKVSFNDSKLVEIGYSSFEGCSLLNRVFLPETVKQIAKNAFDGCNSGCGFFAHPYSLRELLIDLKFSLESIYPCPTEHFTQQGQNAVPLSGIVFHWLIEEE